MRLLDAVRANLLHAQSLTEAFLDFAEDGNIEANVLQKVDEIVLATLGELRRLRAGADRCSALRRGLSLVICGPPNAGKSSLINMLAQRNVAITSPVAGTTRDVLEAPLDLCGYPVVLSDTAGLQDSADPIEAEGIRRAWDRIQHADVLIGVADICRVADNPDDAAVSVPAPARGPRPSQILVLNKSDLLPREDVERIARRVDCIAVSCLDGRGMSELVNRIKEQLDRDYGFISEAPPVSNHRQATCIEQCIQQLASHVSERDAVLRAEHLRRAAHCIGEVTGHYGTEDILDRIFSQFCIGK